VTDNTQSAEQPRTEQPAAADNFARRALLTVGMAGLLVAALFFLTYVINVFLLIFAGLLLAVLLRIPADWIGDHTPLSDEWVLVLVLLAGVGLLGGAGWFFAPIITTQLDQLVLALPEGQEQFQQWLQQYTWSRQLLEQTSMEQLPPLNEVLSGTGSVLSRVSTIFSGMLGVGINLLVIGFIGIFLAFQPDMYINGIIRLLPRQRRARTRQVMIAMGYALRWWLISRVFSMVVIGISTGVGLWLLNVPFALVLGILSGLLNFIPFFGSILAAIPVAIVAIMQGPMTLVYVLLLYMVVQTIESYLLTPLVQQQAVSVPAVLAITFQLLMAAAAGIFGFVLALPLIAAGIVLVRMLYLEDVLGEEVDVAGVPT
jgi:predicted PurR-regulated permease PerM